MPDPTPEPIPKEKLKAAFKAFKKRLKFTRLDAESKLNHGPLSTNKADIVAITPPHEYPTEVWDELVKQGKLKRAGHGMYEMVAEA